MRRMSSAATGRGVNCRAGREARREHGAASPTAAARQQQHISLAARLSRILPGLPATHTTPHLQQQADARLLKPADVVVLLDAAAPAATFQHRGGAAEQRQRPRALVMEQVRRSLGRASAAARSAPRQPPSTGLGPATSQPQPVPTSCGSATCRAGTPDPLPPPAAARGSPTPRTHAVLSPRHPPSLQLQGCPARRLAPAAPAGGPPAQPLLRPRPTLLLPSSRPPRRRARRAGRRCSWMRACLPARWLRRRAPPPPVSRHAVGWRSRRSASGSGAGPRRRLTGAGW